MDDVDEEEEEGQNKKMMTYLRFWSGGKANPIEARGVAVRGAPGHFTQCIDTEDDCDYLNLAVFSWPDTLNSITKKIKMWRIKLELELDV